MNDQTFTPQNETIQTEAAQIDRDDLLAIAGVLPLRSKLKAGAAPVCARRCCGPMCKHHGL